MTERDILLAARDRALETVAAIDAALAAQQGVPVALPSRQSGGSDLVAPCEAAERFGKDISTIRRWARAGVIGQKQGGRWRISIERLKRHIGAP